MGQQPADSTQHAAVGEAGERYPIIMAKVHVKQWFGYLPKRFTGTMKDKLRQGSRERISMGEALRRKMLSQNPFPMPRLS